MKQVYTNLPEIKPSSNPIILDIIHFIDLRDIRKHIYQKFFRELYTPELQDRIQCEERTLVNGFLGQGYEIIDTDSLMHKVAMKEKEIEKRTKEIAKLRHEISVLSKKLNQLEKEINNG